MDGCWGGRTGKAVCSMVSCCRCIWRVVKDSRVAQAEQHSKLKVTKEMMKSQCKTKCVDLGSDMVQSVLTKLRLWRNC